MATVNCKSSCAAGMQAAFHIERAWLLLNAANEAAVGQFLAGGLRFLDIARVCRDVLDRHHYSARPTLAELSAIDRWAREEVSRWSTIRHQSRVPM